MIRWVTLSSRRGLGDGLWESLALPTKEPVPVFSLRGTSSGGGTEKDLRNLWLRMLQQSDHQNLSRVHDCKSIQIWSHYCQNKPPRYTYQNMCTICLDLVSENVAEAFDPDLLQEKLNIVNIMGNSIKILYWGDNCYWNSYQHTVHTSWLLHKAVVNGGDWCRPELPSSTWCPWFSSSQRSPSTADDQSLVIC